MSYLRGIGWGVLCWLVLLGAPPVMAEDPDPYALSEGFEGYLTLGGAGLFTDDESFKLGEYNGLTGNEGYLVGETDLFYNRGGYYFDLSGRNLGLENRSVRVESGRYGGYSFFAEYDQGPHLINGVNQTVFQNPGSSFLTLNPGFTQGANTGAMTFGNRAEGLGIRRDASRFGFESLFKDFKFGMTYERREVDGLMSMGAPFGNSASPTVSRSVVLPETVDSVTNTLHGNMEYAGDRGQYQVYFDLSWYDNRVENMRFQNPFTGVAGHPATGLISRPPDNQHWRAGFSGGYNFSERTRFAGTVEYGIMRQNDPLVPFSVGTGASLLPRQSADAEIHTFLTTFNLSHRPTAKLSTNLRFRHYQTINHTPRQFFNYVVNDNTGGQVGLSNSLGNLPFDTVQDRLNLDISYYLLKATTLKLGYQWEIMDRTYREVDEVKENTFTAGLRSGYFENIVAGYQFSLALREETDPYEEARVFADRHHPSTAPGFDTNPEMRRYDVAERTRFRHDVNLSYFPTERLDLGFFYNFMEDKYDARFLGLESFKQHAFTFDVGYQHARNMRFHFYYTLEKIETIQNNRSFNNTAQSVDPTRNWAAIQDNVVHTFGAGLDYKARGDRLRLALDYWYSNSEEDIRFRAGSSLATPRNVPALITRTQNVDVKGTYKVRKNLDVGLRYLFQMFETDDFATDGFTPSSTQIVQVLTLSGTVRDYEAHTGMLFFTYRLGD